MAAAQVDHVIPRTCARTFLTPGSTVLEAQAAGAASARKRTNHLTEFILAYSIL
jgi:hypothetical protein